jgi:hypothetical protein
MAAPSSDGSVDLNNDGVNDFEDYVQRDATGNITKDGNGKPFFGGLLGDCDDIIGMTIRSLDLEFSGQSFNVQQATGLITAGNPFKLTNEPTTLTAYSPYAEVVWWTSFIDRNGSGYWDLNEPRMLHRRQLLVRSELNIVHSADPAYGTLGSVKANTPYYFKIPVPSSLTDPTAIYLYDVYQYADVSMRPDFDLSAKTSFSYIYFVANSLADLARRENRFMHQWNYGGYSVPGMDTGGPNPPQLHNFPYALDLNTNYAGNLQPNANPFYPGPLQPRHQAPSSNPNQGSQYRWALFDGGRRGEDVILGDLLAFDVRVFDPEAIVRPDKLTTLNTATLSDSALQPGDAGYAYAVASAYSGAPYGYSWPGMTPPPFVKNGMGAGAYVDVGYGTGLGSSLPFLSVGAVPATNVRALLFQNYNQYSPVLGSSQFADVPSAPQSFINYDVSNSTTWSLTWQNTLGLTWDTWSATYERDGINQDAVVESTPIVDEGTNGIDNDGNNGVDDPGERETVPPYANPLRGVQVRVRVADPGTRQVRQATVISDFMKQ